MIRGRAFLETWRDYFLTTFDDRSCIWDFPDGLRSEVLVGNQDFRLGDASWWITIIDPYKGRQPVLLNREFFLSGKIPIAIYPTVLLDSQVVNALHTYVTSPDAINASMREAIRGFLSFIKSRNFDFSTIFYNAEMAAKSDPGKRESYARDRAATVFALQTMDVQQFLQTGRVIPDPTAQAAQLAYSGVRSVDELIARYVEVANDALAQEAIVRVDFIYASLLKIALIQRQMRGDILAKYRAVREFMERILGIVLAGEIMLALSYFAHPQRYQRFIRPLQPEMRFTNFRHNLRASAWDLWLVNLPEQLLHVKMPDAPLLSRSCYLSYVCTAEHALRDIMSPRSIAMVFQCEPEFGGIQPIIEYDMEMVGAVLGEEALDAMLIEEHEWQANRIVDSIRQPISSDALADVITRLEAEAAAICKPGT